MGLALAAAAVLALTAAGIALLGRTTRLSAKSTALLAAVGGGGWLLAKIPKAIVVLPYMAARDLPFQMTRDQLEAALRQDMAFLALGALAAGLFEELLKPAGLLVYGRRRPIPRPVAAGWIVGLGAGWLEAANVLAGGVAVFVGGAGVEAALAGMHAPVERLLVIVFHGAMTGLFVGALSERRLLAAAVPVLLHSGVDFVVPYLQLRGTVGGGWAALPLIAAFVLLAVLASLALVGGPTVAASSKPESTR